MPMRTSLFTVAVAVACGAAWIGCSKRYEPEPRMAPASGTQPVTSAYPVTSATASPEPGSDLYAPANSPTGNDSNDETTVRTSDQAIDALTEARCAHQSRCGRIGANRQFPAWDDCVNDERAHARANMKGCSGRISGTTLEACLNDLRTQDCDAMPDSLDRMTSCAGARLCSSNDQSSTPPAMAPATQSPPASAPGR
jgi:hypothetical protein